MNYEEPEKCPPRPSRLPPPEHQDDIGFQVSRLHHLTRRLMNRYAAISESPAAHGWLIGYLYVNQDRDLYQRDLQEQFSVGRSTMTGILQLMEKNGLITREPVEWDQRLKKICLTPKAVDYHQKVGEGIRRTEAFLDAGLAPEEKVQFIRLCQKLYSHIEKHETEDKAKKEGTVE